MGNFVGSVIIVGLLCASAGAGMIVRARLPETHRQHETMELIRLISNVLVTFAALVLGLVTASVKSGYDQAVHDRQNFAVQLTQLDQCLRDYGPEAEPSRAFLHSYTAGVIASVWPTEPPPVGVSYPDVAGMPRLGAVPALAQLLNQSGLDINRLAPENPYQFRIIETCRGMFRDVLRARVSVIEESEANLSTPFYRVLVFWLIIIFASLGLVAPRHTLSMVILLLCAISLSSAIFVIDDLSRPYDGLFAVPSTAMRTALAAMVQR